MHLFRVGKLALWWLVPRINIISIDNTKVSRKDGVAGHPPPHLPHRVLQDKPAPAPLVVVQVPHLQLLPDRGSSGFQLLLDVPVHPDHTHAYEHCLLCLLGLRFRLQGRQHPQARVRQKIGLQEAQKGTKVLPAEETAHLRHPLPDPLHRQLRGALPSGQVPAHGHPH